MPSVFSRGFQTYLSSSTFSDVVIRVSNRDVGSLRRSSFTMENDPNSTHVSYREYKAHRIVLAHSSEFFDRLLTSQFRESSQKLIDLRYPDPEGSFSVLLKFMYGGILPGLLATTNVVHVMAMADHYLVHELVEICREYILRNVNKNNALMQILMMADDCRLADVVEHTSNILSKNFQFIDDPDFSCLRYEVFYDILHHPYLAVRDERELYEAILRYAKKNKLSTEHINNLLEAVRFRWMTYEQLEKCKAEAVVPQYLLLEAIMARLKVFECAPGHSLSAVPDISESLCVRLRRRISCITFEYDHDFDDRGIIHYLTCGNRWNHSGSRDITVTASSTEMGRASDLLSRTPTELWTKDIPASWFSIDFGLNRGVSPTHYTLRHGGNYRADSLRTWDLQGSKDGKIWVVLRRHNHDTSLVDKFATSTWTIDRDDTPVETVGMPHHAYRFFRILQTARNSSNHNFLVLSGIELYGDLFEWKL
ncbi:hypothetical protein PROFUN_11014 [Planoprotostelium fungivorum]|uniref:BTB domain-containing protein n=1 Tax=Planoprotostelium fungivorum TaxID=1890364 RepID=A0A2P6NBS6_9EUKA|nr:hypothetical protein PROFUN_11014 [Planoprotostelium fungivorum]